MDLFESFATATFNYNPDAERPLHPVTFYNVKTNQPVKVDVLPDTGATLTLLNDKYVNLLGVDRSNATEAAIEGIGDKEKPGIIATVPMRIANLAPVKTDVIFIPGADVNILGRQRGFGHFQTTFTWNKLHYQEVGAAQHKIIENIFGLLHKARVDATAAKAKKAAAYAQSYAAFRGRR